MSTPEQLRKRWNTEEGKKVREKIIANSCDLDWERYLIGFPYSSEIKNNRDLRYIDFSLENFFKASIKYIKEGKAIGPNFSNADLTGANFFQAFLISTNFKGATIKNADFLDSTPMRSNFENSIIIGSSFIGADLWGSNFRFSKIENSDFYGSNLTNVNLSNTVMNNCKIYGVSAWGIKRNENTKTRNLIISPKNSKDVLITVDDIELAQFIYLILDNKKISNLITTMRTKIVLLLGSFYDDGKSKITPKKVIDKIKEILPKYNLIPIVFDFSNSEKQDLISTVRTLALLSSFIIVDLSAPAGQLFELGTLVQTTPIPFIPIASISTKHITSMIQEKGLGNYHWFCKDYFRYSLEGYKKQIPEIIEKRIIPWAQSKNVELEGQRIKK